MQSVLRDWWNSFSGIPEGIWEFRKNKKSKSRSSISNCSSRSHGWSRNMLSRIGHSHGIGIHSQGLDINDLGLVIWSLGLQLVPSIYTIRTLRMQLQSERTDSTNSWERIPPIPENGFHQSLRTDSTNPWERIPLSLSPSNNSWAQFDITIYYTGNCA